MEYPWSTAWTVVRPVPVCGRVCIVWGCDDMGIISHWELSSSLDFACNKIIVCINASLVYSFMLCSFQPLAPPPRHHHLRCFHFITNCSFRTEEGAPCLNVANWVWDKLIELGILLWDYCNIPQDSPNCTFMVMFIVPHANITVAISMYCWSSSECYCRYRIWWRWRLRATVNQGIN